jgi:hypothetical protein
MADLHTDTRPATSSEMLRARVDALHEEAVAVVDAPASEIFTYLDDHALLATHMRRRSWMMMGGRMTYEFDALEGRAVGSVIKLAGRVLGLTVEVAEVVTEREPSHRKVWKTVGSPRMWVIADYRMGFDLSPDSHGATRLRVFIDFVLPSSLIGRALGKLFAKPYARWCVTRMASDAAQHFRDFPPRG